MQEIEYEYRPPRRTEYEKAGNQRLPNEIPTTASRPVVNDPKEPLGTMALHWPKQLAEPLGTMALHWPQEIDQVSIPESGLAGLVCFSSVSFFSRQGFLAS